jgi:hypothetical protein
MKSRSFLVLIWAGVLVALGLTTPSARAAVGLTGVISSVDVEGRKLVVTPSGTEKNVTVTVTDQTRITTVQGQLLRLADLKRNDTVGIAHQNGAATSIVVNQAPLMGIVSTIDVDGKKLVVTENGTNRDVTVSINDRTAILTSAGEAIELKNLKSGDGVAITYSGPHVTRINVNTKPAELTGHVKEVGADMKSLVVTEIGTGNDVKIAITPSTTIVTGQGQTLSLKDLKKGDGVGIAHEASVASKIVVNAAPAR